MCSAVIDKTAAFVSKNGEKFVERIREKEIDNPKFNFLNPNDPYYAYYRLKATEPQDESVGGKKEEVKKEGETPAKKIPKEPAQFEFIAEMPSISAQDLDVLKLTAQFVARNGRAFMTGLSQRESRNYQFDFLRPNHSLFPYFTKLVEQYSKVLIPPKQIRDTLQVNANDKTKLLDRVMQRSAWTTYQETERKRAEDEAEKEKEAFAAIDWHDFGVIGTIEFTGEEDVAELPPPLDLASLQKRTLVDKKTMPLHQPLLPKAASPPPGTSPSSPEEIEMDVEMEIDDDTAQEKEAEDLVIPTLPQGPLRIVKDYVPRALQGPKDKEATFTFKGVQVPASQLDSHMRIELLDPKWKEQKEISERKNKESNLAPDELISANLQNFAKYRTDIFGSVEVGIGRKVGEEEERAKIQKELNAWDGTSAITAPAKSVLDEQIDAIHRTGMFEEKQENMVGPFVPEAIRPPGFGSGHQPTLSQPPMPPGVPPPAGTLPLRPPGVPGMSFPPQPPGMSFPGQPPIPGFAPGPPGFGGHAPPGVAPKAAFSPPPSQFFQPPLPPGVPPFLPPGMAPPAPSQEPLPKKQKLDDGGLIPEDEYLASNRGPVSIRVHVQESEEKGTWKLNGQTINLSLEISETVGKLKDLLQPDLDMPPNKMNLKLITAKDPDSLGYLRDQNTLAYYNINNVSILQLTKKERGRKK